MNQEGPHFSPHSKAKADYKSTNLRKIGNYSGISDIAFASVYSEKTRQKKLIMIIIIMNLSPDNGFWRVLEIDFRYETKASKVMVHFKFDALYR